jgi:23S rRNA pseudouridine1911/1915/1917 synthase
MEILFSDKEIAVCVKPVGMDSEHDVPAELKNLLGGEIFPLHRLDKNVGGVMVYARTKPAAALFSRLIQENKLVKEYVALVHGQVPEQGDWEDLLFKDSRKNKVFVVKRQRAGVKAARLEFVRQTDSDPALVRIRLHTGRTHQIRVQFSSRGFPLVGDHKYGARDDANAPFLHSCCITFPYKGKDWQFSHLPHWAAPLTADTPEI